MSKVSKVKRLDKLINNKFANNNMNKMNKNNKRMIVLTEFGEPFAKDGHLKGVLVEGDFSFDPREMSDRDWDTCHKLSMLAGSKVQVVTIDDNIQLPKDPREYTFDPKFHTLVVEREIPENFRSWFTLEFEKKYRRDYIQKIEKMREYLADQIVKINSQPLDKAIMNDNDTLDLFNFDYDVNLFTFVE